MARHSTNFCSPLAVQRNMIGFRRSSTPRVGFGTFRLHKREADKRHPAAYEYNTKANKQQAK